MEMLRSGMQMNITCMHGWVQIHQALRWICQHDSMFSLDITAQLHYISS